MHELSTWIVSAEDTHPERRIALQVIAELNEAYRGRLQFSPTFSGEGTPDVLLALVWSEPGDQLERALEVGGPIERLLLRKTSPVPVDLSDRSQVMARLRARAHLDELLSASPSHLVVVPFEHGGLWSALDRALRSVADNRLGVDPAPLNLRPQLGGTYVRRTRLLDLLPDSPGHVVHLDAPHGFGKSVLAAQWADALEADGWRVTWLAFGRHQTDLRTLVTAALRLPGDTPDALVRDRLWEVPTLVVLEDLTRDVDLELVLGDVRGLVVLAGREVGTDDALDALTNEGRVTRLGAAELAFSRREATHLVGEEALGEALHAQTLGWPLPLHIASLTGSETDAASLLAGIRASSTGPAWRELLFLAALPYAPDRAATPETMRLVSKGFVQALETSYRLHPYLAGLAFETHANEIAEIVVQEARRLPLLLQGEAFERVGDFERLAGVLEATDAELWRHAPARIVQWDEAVKGLMSPRRHWAVGAAHQRLADFEAAIARLSLALDAPGLSPDEQLGIMRELCVPLGIIDNPRGQALLERAEPLLDRADPERAARFLGNAAIVYAHAGEPERAIHIAERALEYYPDDSPHKVSVEVNLALFRWDLHGDFEYRLNAQLATLERIDDTYPVQAVGQRRDIGMFHWWLGDWAKARAWLEQARDREALNPAIGTEARGALGYLDGDIGAVSRACATARLFAEPVVADMTSMYAILLELEAGAYDRAQRTFERSPRQLFASSAYARVLAAQGDRKAALELLDGFDPSDRARRLYLFATRYLITRDETDLEAFLGVTTAGRRLLPGFIPIAALPDEPELAEHYPIEDVLGSARKDAIELRKADIPDLQLTLLGEVSARLLDVPVDLADRQRQILTLLALGATREQVAEAVWPEVGGKKQRNNLNVQLNALRKAIEPWGVATYLFENGLQRVSSDYRALTAALAASDAEAAYSVYRDPLAPGIDLSPVEQERRRLREEVVELLYRESDGAPSEVASRYLELVLELEPLHEEALQRHLTQLVRRGRRREARLRFDAFAERLHGEMGLEPLEETVRILARQGT